MNERKIVEGEKCEELLTHGVRCEGVLEFAEVENCSCHINPPCSACENQSLICPICGWEE